MAEYKDIARMKEILEAHGIRLKVTACGCCGSPWVYFEYLGEKIIYDTDDPDNPTVGECNFSMLPQDEGKDDDDI